tara:strand:+ start:37328 stop:39745 length:2418 start_codon:yes stop_codon:yes gene_type:complete
MAKRNKPRNTQQAVAIATKPVTDNKVMNGLSAIANLLKDDDSADHGPLAEKLKIAQTSHNAASEDQKSKLAASLEEDLQSIVGELKKSIDTNKKLEVENKNKLSRAKQLEDTAEESKKKTESERKELDKSHKELASSLKEHAEEKADIAKRLMELKEQELDAESGFANKQFEMLEKFEDDKHKLLEKLETKKTDLEEQIAEMKLNKSSLSQEDKSLFEQKLQSLVAREDVLAEKLFTLKQEKVLIERKLKQAEMSEEDTDRFKASLREEVKVEYLQKISTLETQKQHFEQQIEKYKDAENQLLKQLAAFKDIERQFEEASPEQILQQLQEYKTKIHDLKMQLDEKPSEQIEADFRDLKNQHDTLEQEYKNVQGDLQRTKTLLHKNQMSVIDLEQVEKQKQALAKHNELLKGALEQLGADVDELVNKQQSKTAFPALIELDNKLRSKSLTERVPSLAKFAKELQQRIAWDAKENKALYYRLEDIQVFIAGLSMSRLHILQGISGTGKTSLAKAFARAVGGGCKTISVQAGWRDKSDLVGHFNAFEKKFYELETLQGLYEAQCPFYADRPYIILLDEMNLSRPEQYFAEFLSALELDPKDRILPLMTTSQANGPELLIDGRKVAIPNNVWFIGTANHDETTFEFADKTYDRAHVMELPRRPGNFEIDKSLDPITYSYSSLETAFDEAAIKHQESVISIIKAMDDSLFSDCLEQDFNVSWGNRLERHLTRFIPVMIECGNDLGFALDHMLATKVFRAGKVTGRYDTDPKDIVNLIDLLKEFWSEQSLKSQPTACLKLLNTELKKKSNI